MLPEKFETHVSRIDGGLESNFILKDSFAWFYIQMYVIGYNIHSRMANFGKLENKTLAQ